MLNGVSLFVTFRVLSPARPPARRPAKRLAFRCRQCQCNSHRRHGRSCRATWSSPTPRARRHSPFGATKGGPPPPVVVVASAATTGAGSASAAVIAADADPGHDPGGGALSALSAAGAHRSKRATGRQRGPRKRAALCRDQQGARRVRSTRRLLPPCAAATATAAASNNHAGGRSPRARRATGPVGGDGRRLLMTTPKAVLMLRPMALSVLGVVVDHCSGSRTSRGWLEVCSTRACLGGACQLLERHGRHIFLKIYSTHTPAQGLVFLE